jgi:curved DNA-binding protein CbpA
MFKDYYAILNIPQSATSADIKSAYRIQAMKWHPDKNKGIDTTEQMKEINEAKLILSDSEARIRYDKEYLRFKSFQQEKAEQQQQNENKEKERKKEGKPQEKKSEQPKEEFKSYKIDDEILKKWMENARKQAIRNVQEMITEFRDSSLIGFGTFFKTAIMAIVIGVIFFIIVQILKTI